jgi:FkbM family methyltransferase
MKTGLAKWLAFGARFYENTGWYGLRDALRFSFCELTHRRKMICRTLAGVPVHMRTASSDVTMAASMLIREEYADVVCKAPRVIVDLGANIGASALYFARKFTQARIIAVEPEKENYRLLVKNTEAYPAIVPVQAAIWSHSGQRALLDRSTGEVGYTLCGTDTPAHSLGQQVECMTLDELLARHSIDRVDILKMDIEGAEKDVMEAAGSWIEKVDILTVELHDRIQQGCTQTFRHATRDFQHFLEKGEKVTAFRHWAVTCKVLCVSFLVDSGEFWLGSLAFV